MTRFIAVKVCPKIFDSEVRGYIIHRNEDVIIPNLMFIFTYSKDKPKRRKQIQKKLRKSASNRKGDFSHSKNRSISMRLMSSPVRSLKKDTQKIVSFFDKFCS